LARVRGGNALQLQCIELYGGVVRGFLLQPLVCMYLCMYIPRQLEYPGGGLSSVVRSVIVLVLVVVVKHRAKAVVVAL